MRIFCLLAVLLITAELPAQTTVSKLFCEHREDPSGIEIKNPLLAWELASAVRSTRQTAYEIRVATAASLKKPLWQSGKASSDQSAGVAYAGPDLQSGMRYYWQVRVWDNRGKASPWSKTGSWQMGLLQRSDWKAKWIEPAYPGADTLAVSPLLRKTFTTAKNIRRATAFITSHGLYEAFINGARVGDAWLTPGWTSYNKRLQYQVYDVTGLVQRGGNAIGVALGNGWYRSTLAWSGNRNLYGKTLGLLMQLELEYSDGSRETVVTDESWKSSTGSICFSEIYDGETIDARLEKKNWNKADFDDTGWVGVKQVDHPMDPLTATLNEPVKKQEALKPVKIFRTPKGELVVDFGQNMTGWVEVKLKGQAGDTVRMYHAEVLDKEGNFYTANLRSAKQLNTYVLAGGGEESFHPHFSFQGFRYIRLEGLRGEPKPEQFSAVALYSDMAPTGSFSSSSDLLNQLQHNIQWGQVGNFLDVPTDCPQRDERLGWTGDAQVFSRTAAFNRQVFSFFQKWLKDVAADQLPNGSVPFVVPNVLGKDAAGSTGWADAATIIPWNCWLAYGDKRILEEQYESMKAWVGYMEANSKNDLWAKGFHFGDWLFYRPDDDNDGMSAITDKYLIAQCFFAGSADILLKTAALLGHSEDAAHYRALGERLRAAFVKEYMTPNGRLVSGSQTAYVLALQFDMLPEALRAGAAERLAENIKRYNYHLTTGFLGTPYLCHVLSRFGYNDLAYTLLMQESYPSWLYPVKMGATTIWERWDGIKPNGSFQNVGMNSFNHYAYGAIGDWMYRVLAGIDTDPEQTGYKKIRIQPLVNAKRLNMSREDSLANRGSLQEVKAELLSPYGKIVSHWKKEGGRLHVYVEVPVNTSASLVLPGLQEGGLLEYVSEGDKTVPVSVPVSSMSPLTLELGSGRYHFVSSNVF